MEAKVTTGKKIRNWGGWYRHDAITLDGVEIGQGRAIVKPQLHAESAGRVPAERTGAESQASGKGGNKAGEKDND